MYRSYNTSVDYKENDNKYIQINGDNEQDITTEVLGLNV